MKEHQWEKLLNIKTSGLQLSSVNVHYHRYEPTPYSALDELFESYEVPSHGRVVDFGCGKGRLIFYLHYRFNASILGVEMNEDLHWSAVENYKSYAKKHRTSEGQILFYCGLAEQYRIDEQDTLFYFFNPFSTRVFETIVRNILRSYEETPRDMEVLLYYPSEDYIYFMENETPFHLIKDIALRDLYQVNPYERFVTYRLGVSR